MYSCFISYCHGQHELMRRFIEQLKRALKSSLEPWLDEEVYIDEERLSPGYHFNEELARAVCESICMIVVYTPKYERHSYCRREYAGMKCLEEKRRALLGNKAPKTRGMIIPILFRGHALQLPDEIRQHTHFCDFSKFTTASIDINQNIEYVEQIEKIAKLIHEHYLTISAAGIDFRSECESFSLPPEDQVTTWRPGHHAPTQPFPGR